MNKTHKSLEKQRKENQISFSNQIAVEKKKKKRMMMGKQEKSNFSVTCSLLSQYLKQNRSFGDLMAPLSHEPKGPLKPPTTMSLLPGVVVSEQEQEEQIKNTKTMNFFSENIGFSSSENSHAQANERDPENPPLTIFYNGTVLVFDKFPAEKAMEILQFAGHGLTTKQDNTTAQEHPLKPQPSSNSSVIPMARRASLHRFLEKRKERINAHAPYQLNVSSPKPCKPEESKLWLGLGLQVSQTANH